MIDEQFVYLAALINCIAGVRYIMDTVRVRVRPNPVSWGLWAATGWLAFGGQLDEGVGLPALLTLSVAVVPTLILVACFVEIGARPAVADGGGSASDRQGPPVRVNAHPSWAVTKLDAVCGVSAVVALVVWQLTASGNIAIGLSIVVDALAGIPTIAKAYGSPRTESALPYVGGIVSGGITLLTLTTWTFSDGAFATYFVVLNVVIAFPLVLHWWWNGCGPGAGTENTPSTRGGRGEP